MLRTKKNEQLDVNNSFLIFIELKMILKWLELMLETLKIVTWPQRMKQLADKKKRIVTNKSVYQMFNKSLLLST